MEDFAEYLMGSGIICNDELTWLVFHGSFDFGYMLKILTGLQLPKSSEDFFKSLKLYCPNIYDIKYITLDVEYCELVEEDRTVDNCYSNVAELTKDKSICKDVSEIRRDYCYMPFMMDGDYEVCAELKNKYLKQSCDTLSKVKKS